VFDDHVHEFELVRIQISAGEKLVFVSGSLRRNFAMVM